MSRCHPSIEVSNTHSSSIGDFEAERGIAMTYCSTERSEES